MSRMRVLRSLKPCVLRLSSEERARICKVLLETLAARFRVFERAPDEPTDAELSRVLEAMNEDLNIETLIPLEVPKLPNF